MVTLLDPNRITYLEERLQNYKQLLSQREELDRRIAAVIKELKESKLVALPSNGEKASNYTAPKPVAGTLETPPAAAEKISLNKGNAPKSYTASRTKRRRVLSKEHKQKISDSQKKRHREQRKAARV